LNRLFDFRNPDIRGLVDDEAAGRLDELADELDEKGGCAANKSPE
jgi:hypothetical protein